MDQNKFQGTFHNTSLPERISDRILDLIRSGELKPGEKLPPERNLAEIMQVSRASLRESIRSLATMNVLEMRQGSGTYVTSLEPELLVEKLELVFSVNDSTFLDLVQARMTIEPQLARLAAERATDAQLGALTEIMQQTETCVKETPHEFPTFDIGFHVAVAEAAGNVTLLHFLRATVRLTFESSRRTATDIESIHKAHNQHLKIYQAIIDRNADLAGQLMREHLEGVEEKIKSLYD